MSRARPWAPVIDAEVERQVRLGLLGIAAEVKVDYQQLDTPYETGLLLDSLEVNLVAPTTLRFTESARDAETGFDYGELLNRVNVIVPTRAKLLSWVDKLTGERAFARYVVNVHKNWWDNWRDGEGIQAAIRRGWTRRRR